MRSYCFLCFVFCALFSLSLKVFSWFFFFVFESVCRVLFLCSGKCFLCSFFFVLQSIFRVLSAFFSLFPESVFFPLMILSILFHSKYPILFVALNFADIALILLLFTTGMLQWIGWISFPKGRGCPCLRTKSVWFISWRKAHET